MIIGACGFGSTGSSAVTDYLKEYDSFQVLDKIEFTWVSAVDGLIDLDYHLNHPHNRTMDSIFALERYKQLSTQRAATFQRTGMTQEILQKSVDDFLSSIIQTSWKWNKPGNKSFWDKQFRWLLKKIKFVSRWEIKHGRQWNKYPYEDVYLSVKPENFDEAARTHVRELLAGIGADFNKPIILDQPFPGNNPQACFKFFDDPYAVVVDRDPRDNYVFARTKLLGKWHLMPVEPVEEFVKYYRALRKNQPYTEPSERILSIKFEDMVYHYDETTARLRDFLHLPDNPAPKTIFDPSISMPNTQVWKRFPQFAKDVEYIEKELPEYLFDYTGCPEPDPNGKMFYGKSPKNKK
jgi:hypothetical protein